MTSRVWLPILFLVASALAQSPNSSSSKEEELRATEQKRVEALVNSDVPRLEKLLADDLTYTHSTGIKESKAEFLHRIQSGEVKYNSMQHENGASIRLYGDTGVLTGISRIKVSVRGQALNLHIRFTEVWVKRGRGPWQVVAWQSTRIAEE